jgi:hypothetical protein
MKLFFIASLFLVSSFSFAAGLSGGDIFTTTNIEGRLTVSCMGQPQTGPTYGSANCRLNLLNPGEYSYFVGSKVDADSVSLQATWENGKQSKVKTEKYDGVNGKSKKSFNLWISTLLQRPLLDYGMNVVKYTLMKNDTVVEAGTFNVEVKTGEERVCQRIGTYTSSNNQDCANAMSLCDRFFSEQNYCK